MPETAPLFATTVHEGVSLLQCRPLLAANVPHGFTLRADSFGRRDAGDRDRETLSRALGLLRMAFMQQVHGNDVAVAEGAPPPTCDAILTDEPRVGLAVQTADCVPLLLWDERTNVVAAIHAGWRGTLAGVTSRAIDSLRSRYGSDPETMHAAIGPSIRLCCFEVGDEVVDAFAASDRNVAAISRPGPRGRRHLDLVEDNRAQLLSAGLSESRIYDSGRCSYCEAESFYSYRREGPGVGRTMGVIGIAVD